MTRATLALYAWLTIALAVGAWGAASEARHWLDQVAASLGVRR